MGYKISKSSDNKHFFKHSELVLELCYNDNDTLIISINRDLDNYINHHIDTNKDFFNYILSVFSFDDKNPLLFTQILYM